MRRFGFAVLFGIATVPALYWLARPIMKGWQALAVAFLTAVSYHHVWFSQNARGYSAYLLFCVLATGALWRLITDPPQRRWIALYAASAVFGLMSLIITASQRSRSTLSVRNLGRLALPTSSSPSMRKMTFTGSEPLVLIVAYPNPVKDER